MNDVVAIIIAFGSGVLGVIVAGLFQRRKVSAESDNLLAEKEKKEADTNETIRMTVMALITPLKTRISELEVRVTQLEKRATRYLKRIAYLMDGIRCLLEQFESAGIIPSWEPNEWKADDD